MTGYSGYFLSGVSLNSALKNRNHFMIRLMGLLCILALLLVALTVIVSRMLPDTMQVAYQSTIFTIPHQSRIYLMDIRRTLPALLTGESENVLSMNWSPDGTQVVYVTARGSERPNMFILDLQRRITKPIRLDTYPLGAAVNWSPDGHFIAFMGAVNSHPRIVVLNIQSGITHIINVDDNLFALPTWSPDSHALMYLAHEYLSDQNDQPALYAVPVDCHLRATPCADYAVHVLPQFGFHAYSWSPDGTTLVFNGTLNWRTGVYIARLNCPNIVNNCLSQPELVQNTSSHSQPFWSPLGTQIAYGNDLNQIEVIDLQSGTTRQLATTGGIKNELLWSKNGEEIIYEVHTGLISDLFAVNLLTGIERQLTNSLTENRRPKVRPNLNGCLPGEPC